MIARWVVGLAWPVLRLAPVGEGVDSSAAFDLRVSERVDLDPVCQALRLEGWETAAEAAGRALVVDRRMCVPLPLPSGPRRALLVAEAPSRRPGGPRALDGRSGARLAAMVGLPSLAALLWTFDTLNVPDSRAAEEAVAAARGRRILVLGEPAMRRLLDAGIEDAGAASVRPLPHPSGRSTALNCPRARRTVARALLEAAADARGPVSLCCAPGAAAWLRLAELGVAAGADRGVPWRPQSGGGGAHTSAWPGATLVAWPTGRWLVVPDDAARQAEQGVATVGAERLAAEMAARRLGFVDPWHSRETELEARCRP